jgi:hypothetical protein
MKESFNLDKIQDFIKSQGKDETIYIFECGLANIFESRVWITNNEKMVYLKNSYEKPTEFNWLAVPGHHKKKMHMNKKYLFF